MSEQHAGYDRFQRHLDAWLNEALAEYNRKRGTGYRWHQDSAPANADPGDVVVISDEGEVSVGAETSPAGTVTPWRESRHYLPLRSVRE